MSKQATIGLVSMGTAALLWGAPVQAGPPKDPPSKCAADAALVGSVCVDKYEASVWRIPPTNLAGKSNAGLIKKVRKGTAEQADLVAGNATQLGTASDNYAPCTDNAQNCKGDLYAASLPGVTPAAFITWFQANVACANSGKRLPSNAEWQMAVTGSPDPGGDNGTTDCNTASTFAVASTGSRSSCVSAFGAFDMVGNLYEWVADWVPRSTTCGTWSVGVSPTGDDQCLAGAATTGEPGALLRGGNFFFGTFAGPLTVIGLNEPSLSSYNFGFRCAR